MKNKIKGIIFDLGGVLVEDWVPKGYTIFLDDVSKKLSISSENIKKNHS